MMNGTSRATEAGFTPPRLVETTGPEPIMADAISSSPSLPALAYFEDGSSTHDDTLLSSL